MTAALLELLQSIFVLLKIRQDVIEDCSDIDYSSGDWLSRKAKRIEACLNQEPEVNLWELRELALSRGGLLTSNYRQQAWPLLVGLANTTTKTTTTTTPAKTVVATTTAPAYNDKSKGSNVWKVADEQQQQQQYQREETLDNAFRDDLSSPTSVVETELFQQTDYYDGNDEKNSSISNNNNNNGGDGQQQQQQSNKSVVNNCLA